MKKKIPLAILEALQPITDNNLNLVKIIEDTKVISHIVDNDEKSDFFFKVIKQEYKKEKFIYLVEYKPKNKDNVEALSVWLSSEGVLAKIKEWLELLQAYNKIHTIYDDPILRNNQEMFERKFDILDEDADTASFNLSQQMFLDEYLSNVKSKLLLLKEGRVEKEMKELDELSLEVAEIQSELTRATKRQIIKRLSKLWAKAQKIGLDVIKEIFINVTAELTKRLLTGE